MDDHAFTAFISGFFYLSQPISSMGCCRYISCSFIFRGYCYYCPLGTVLSLLSKLAGQKIITDKSECIKCNRCNIACPMTIDIKTKAQIGQVVTDSRCVGCGHCVDSCPTETLGYSTKFLDWVHNKLG